MDREEVLQHVLKETWKPVLDFLHVKKENIEADESLKFAASVIHSEFFSKLKSGSPTISLEHLERWHQLHNGKFYFVDQGNYLELVRELAKRTTGVQSYGYAQTFPEDPVCKEIMKNIPAQFIPGNTDTVRTISNAGWIQIYNRLFEAIDNRSDHGTYFSGPRYIGILKEFLPYHADYSQYMAERALQGLSPSRKNFFYDLLIEQSEDIRIMFVNRILSIIEPFDSLRVQPMRILLDGKLLVNQTTVSGANTKSVFISYSWDDEEHKQWVLNLAEKLRAKHINVIFDRFDLKLGSHNTHFAENAIKRADRIIIIFTPNYKLKAEQRTGGVGFEYSILTNILYNNQLDERLIPIIRRGTTQECTPDFMQHYINLDMTKDEDMESRFNELIKELNGSVE